MSPVSQRGDYRPSVLLLGLVLFIVVLVLYSKTVAFEFVSYDDDGYITSDVRQGLSWQSISWAFSTFGVMGNWHPVTLMSHMLDCQLFGQNAGGHHATNVLLHAVNSVLLLVVLCYATSRLWPSAFVAVAFAIHPLRVESVAWVAERKDVLSLMFGLLAVGAYVAYARRQKWKWYVLSFVLFALAVMSKPMLVTLPCVLLLLDYWPLSRLFLSQPDRHGNSTSSAIRPQALSQLMVEKVPFFLLSVLVCIVTLQCQEEGDALHDARMVPLTLRFANAVVSYVAYIGMTVWPIRLRVLYPHPNLPGGEPWSAIAIAGAFILLFVNSALVFRYRFCKFATVGWLWYLGTMVPVIGLIQVGYQSMADRYTYLPGIGLFILVAWSAAELAERCRDRVYVRNGIAAVGVVWLVAMSSFTWSQTSVWCDSESLYTRAIQFSPSCPVMHNNLGLVLSSQNRKEEAVAAISSAIELDPDYAEAYVNRANAYRDLGQVQLAMADFQQALNRNEKLMAAYFNRGNLYGQLGDFAAAIRDLTTAIQISPDHAKHYEVRGNAYRYLGDNQAAIRDFTEALRLQADYFEATFGRGLAFLAAGQGSLAVMDLEAAAKQFPERLDIMIKLGDAKALAGNVPEAIDLLDRVLQLEPSSENAFLVRGNAHQRLGQNEQAIQDYTRIIELNPDSELAFNNRAAVYLQQGHPKLAMEDLGQIIRLNPQAEMAYFNRGNAYGSINQLEKAIGDFTKAIEVNSNFAVAYYSRGIAHNRLKQYQRAMRDYARAIEIEPTGASSYDALAWLLATCPVDRWRSGTRAVNYAEQACELTGNSQPQYISTLAAACAEVGDYKRAVELQEMALQAIPENLREPYRNRLQLFRKNKTLRD